MVIWCNDKSLKEIWIKCKVQERDVPNVVHSNVVHDAAHWHFSWMLFTQRESCGVVYNFVPPVLSQFKNATTQQPRPIDLMIGFRVLRQSKVWRAENRSLMRRANCWVINSLDKSLQAITKWRCLTATIGIMFSVMIVF